MKIKELLTNEEMNKTYHWGNLCSIDDIEMYMAQHYPEMEVKDYILFRMLQELQNINMREERKADVEGY